MWLRGVFDGLLTPLRSKSSVYSRLKVTEPRCSAIIVEVELAIRLPLSDAFDHQHFHGQNSELSKGNAPMPVKM